MMRRNIFLVCLVLFAPAILAAPVAPDDGVTLTLSRSVLGGIELDWTGDAPPYEVRRGFSPDMAWAGPDNLVVETSGTSWTDNPPSGNLVYYLVNPTGRCFVAGADAYVLNTSPDVNFGSSTFDVVARLNDGGAVERSTFLRFNLDSIPRGSVIHSATLEMLATNTGVTPTWQGTVRRVQGLWSEDTLTWNTRPPFSFTEEERLTFNSGPGWSRWDISALTREWITGTEVNHGVIVSNATLNSVVAFHSREGNEAGGGFHNAPRLCIDWTSPRDEDISRIIENTADEPTFDSDSSRMEFASADLPVNVASQDPVVLALAHLYEYRDLYQLQDPQAQLYLERIRATEGVEMDYDLFFGQRAHNIPVFGAYVEVHVDRNRIQAAGGNFLPMVPAPEQPRILQLEAETMARAAVPGTADAIVGAPKLNYFSQELLTRQPGQPAYRPDQEVRLAWKIGVSGVDAEGLPESWLVQIDAMNRSPLFIQELGEDVCADPKNENIDIQTVDYTTSGTCWNFQTADDRWFNENGATGNYPGTSGDAFSDGQNAFDYSFDIYDFYYDQFCRRSWNGNNGQMEVLVHWGVAPANAAFFKSCGHVVFSDGYMTHDVYGHEFQHGVDGNEAKLKYVDQSGAIDESLADFFGAMIDFEYSDGDWFMGEERPVGNSSCSNAPVRTMRNMTDPPDCSSTLNGITRVHPDHRSNLIPPPAGSTRDSTNDKGWVHINSGLPNKVAFLITDGGTHNGLVINGITRSKASLLYYWTHIRRLGKTSGFSSLRREMIDVAQGWAGRGAHGFGNADTCAVINAWSSVGYGNPDTDCNGTADGFNDGDHDGRYTGDDNCVNVSNWDQSDIDNDGFGDVCDGDIDGDGDLNRDDNCPETANSNQADANGDGIGDVCADDDGDGVLTLLDNCPNTPNGRCSYADDEFCDIDGDGQTRDDEDLLGHQRDFDGDGLGDACDDDIDDDGATNDVDVCDYEPLTSTADGDGDGVGTFCDNCPDIPNPDQADRDGDNEGDVCDSDRDGDGHDNGVDNCPEAANPSQGDNDGNGLGFACDFGEWAHFDGMRRLVELDMYFQFNDPLHPVRFELFPCTDNCPDWIGPEFTTQVVVQMDRELMVRIVDDEGQVVGKSGMAGNHDITFQVDSDYSYRSPATALVPFDHAEAQDRVQMRRYFLEFWLPQGQNPSNVQGTVDVSSVPE